MPRLDRNRISGAEIRRLRERAGLSWEELGRRLGDRALARKLKRAEERGKVVALSFWEALEMDRALDLSPDELHDVYREVQRTCGAPRGVLVFLTFDLPQLAPPASLGELLRHGLRNLRKRAGLTQKELAKRARLPQSTISEVERGRVRGWSERTRQRKVDKILRALLRALGKDPNEVSFTELVGLCQPPDKGD